MVYLLARLALGRFSSRLGRLTHRYWLCDSALVCIWVAVYFRFGVTIQSLAPAILALTAMVVSVVDFRFRLIPDRITIPLGVIGLLLTLVRQDISIIQSLIGGATGLTGFYLLATGGRMVLKKQALGGGDIKLLGALGLYVGWVGVIATAFLGAVLALVCLFSRRLLRHTDWHAPIPFGPFLTYAGVLWFLLGMADTLYF